MKNLIKIKILILTLSFLILPSFSFAQTNTIDYICNGGPNNGASTVGGSWDSNEAALAGCRATCTGGNCSPQQVCPTGQTWDTTINACALETVVTTSAPADLSSGTGEGLVPKCPPNGCGWPEFLELIQKVINFLIFGLSLPITAIVFAYSGFLFMTSGDDSSKRSKAKSIFWKVFVGFVIAMAAWLIVNTILTTLISKARLTEQPELILLEQNP